MRNACWYSRRGGRVIEVSVRLLLVGLVAIVLTQWRFAETVEATFPGQNGRIAFATDSGIGLINADGSGFTQLTKGPGGVRAVGRWSHDGKKLAFARSVTSPDGLKIVFDRNGGIVGTAEYGGAGDIFVIRAL